VVESASGIGLTGRLGEEEYWKDRAQDGAILAVPVRMADRRECSDRKIGFAMSRSGEIGKGNSGLYA
jgi:hypothetical protein